MSDVKGQRGKRVEGPRGRGVKGNTPSAPLPLDPVAPSGETGLSLVELVIVLAVFVVLAAALRPTILSQVVDAQSDATRTEAKALYEAMVGSGAPTGPFGFVGDFGRLPRTFAELVQPGGLPLPSTSTVRNVGMGWKGPYVNMGSSPTDYLSDAFGRAYTGASSGRVISAGANGIVGDADDIVYPPNPPYVFGAVTIVVKTIVGGKTVVDPLSVEVHLYYANNGVQAVRKDSVPPFVFANVHQGEHAILVVKRTGSNAGSVVAQETIVSPGGGRSRLAELWY